MSQGGESCGIFYTAAVKPESDKALFHVKQWLLSATIEMNYNSLFTDAEFPKDRIKNVLNIDSAKQTAQRLRRHPQLLGDQFVALSSSSQTSSQSVSGFA
jgi:hypothetical protein